jgi:hypothetical protein
MPQPERESVCGRRIVDAYQVNRGLQVIHGQMIHQGMTRISTPLVDLLDSSPVVRQ